MYHCRTVWNTLKHKRNAKPTLIGAVDGGTGTIGSHVAKLVFHIFIPSVHFKQKSEVSAQKLSSQQLQRLFPILHEKGSFYSRKEIRSKQTDYANFQKKKKGVYTIWIFKEKKKFRKRQTWNTLSSFLHDVKSSKFTSETTEKLYRNGLACVTL